MKIVHIITSMTAGGAQSLLIELLKSWPTPDDKHVVISLREKSDWVNRLIELNIPTYCLNMNPGSLTALLKMPQLIKLIRAEKLEKIAGK